MKELMLQIKTRWHAWLPQNRRSQDLAFWVGLGVLLKTRSILKLSLLGALKRACSILKLGLLKILEFSMRTNKEKCGFFLKSWPWTWPIGCNWLRTTSPSTEAVSS
jgi:hypothetical protein